MGGANMTQKQQEARAKGAIKQWYTSKARSLHDVYKSFSEAKSRAWAYCEWQMYKHNGSYLRVISHNVNIFTAGFEFVDPETGVVKFYYITPTYDVIVDMV